MTRKILENFVIPLAFGFALLWVMEFYPGAITKVLCSPFVAIAGLFESFAHISNSDVKLIACICFVFVIVSSATNKIIAAIKKGEQ
jgi:archaellum biogenesis protein FlaJ (TadC family)